MQQEEIARLRKNTKKIREKASSELAAHGQEREEDMKPGEQHSVEQPKVRSTSNDDEIKREGRL